MTADPTCDVVAMDLDGNTCEPTFHWASTAVLFYRNALHVVDPADRQPSSESKLILHRGNATYQDIGLFLVETALPHVACGLAWTGERGSRPRAGMLAVGVRSFSAATWPVRVTAEHVNTARSELFAEVQGEHAIYMKHEFPVEFHQLDLQRLAAMQALAGGG